MRVPGVAITLVLWTACAAAQALPSLDDGYRDMYNLQFQAAHQVFQQWQNANPQDPLGPVSDAAAYLFAEFDRLHVLESELFTDDNRFRARSKLLPDPEIKRAFDAQLARADSLAGSRLTAEPGDANALFARIMALGLRGDYAALIEKRDLASLNYIKTGRALAEQLLAHNSNYYDAYLAVGVENYLLSLQSAPMRWLLRMTGAQTSKQDGLRDLRLTAEHGRYLLPYARLLLAVAAVRDHDRAQARDLLEGLARQFPENHLYVSELAKLQ
ncbi:MAG TPA: hypothetical protein VL240_04175 [Candidatus Binatia bacterium]|nr:hypothetical protein [Candidatus Binatia bacterium]